MPSTSPHAPASEGGRTTVALSPGRDSPSSGLSAAPPVRTGLTDGHGGVSSPQHCGTIRCVAGAVKVPAKHQRDEARDILGQRRAAVGQAPPQPQPLHARRSAARRHRRRQLIAQALQHAQGGVHGGEEVLAPKGGAGASVLRPVEPAARRAADGRAELEHQRLEQVEADQQVRDVRRGEQLAHATQQRLDPRAAAAAALAASLAASARRGVEQRQLGQQRGHLCRLAHDKACGRRLTHRQQRQQRQLERVAGARVEDGPLRSGALAQSAQSVELRDRRPSRLQQLHRHRYGRRRRSKGEEPSLGGGPLVLRRGLREGQRARLDGGGVPRLSSHDGRREKAAQVAASWALLRVAYSCSRPHGVITSRSPMNVNRRT